MTHPLPTVGRVVHYQPRTGKRVLMAHVVRVWTPEETPGYPPGTVNLQVMLDGTNEARERDEREFSEEEQKRGMAWRTSVHPSPSGQPEPGHWHWPPRVG